MKGILLLLLAIVLVGCAQTQSAKTVCRCRPLPTRTLESFGCIDSTTTFEDIEARVGPLDFGMNLSGHLSGDYHLTGDSWLRFQMAGRSKILSVTIVSRKHKDIVVYDGFETESAQPAQNPFSPVTPVKP